MTESARPPATSAAGLANGIDNLGDWAVAVLKSVTRSGGMITLFAADTVASGLVAQQGFAAHPNTTTVVFGWLVSAGLSAATISVWSAVWSRLKGVSLTAIIFGLLLMAADAWLDSKLATLWLYGVETMQSTMFIPEGAGGMWWTEEIVILLATICSDAIILLIRLTRKREMEEAAAMVAAPVPVAA